ncbi:MAG: PQQ-binding-like beta-propeller repeat protein [Phenylobacterium sp.]
MAFRKMAAALGAGAVIAVLAAGGYALAQADAPPHPGKEVYDRACAACHNAPEAGSRAAPVANLRKMSASALRTVLTTGVMKPMGDSLSPRELRDVIDYLAAPEASVGTAWIDGNMCAADRRGVDLSARPAQIGFGVDHENSRSMSAAQAGLTTRQAANLEVAWAFAMPKTGNLRGQGVVVGSTLFYPAAQAGYVLALDTRSGCVKWATPTPAGIRNSLAYGRLGPKGPLAVVGGDGANLIALDARTGQQVWKVDPRHDKATPLSGTPIFAGDKIIVPISAIDVALAMRPTHACCKSHGAVVAIEAATGKTLWTWHTMEDSKPLGRKTGQGLEAYGPSGAPIWSSPSVDLRKGVVYASTGENTSPPATGTSDAIVALDLATGQQRWVFQALANDVWNMSCPVGLDTSGRPPGPNCYFAGEGSVLRDHDFGGGPVIVRGKGGRDTILGGQKSGDVWALDAATGKVRWHRQFGEGTALGGVHWGIATDGVRVFAPISDPGVPAGKSAAGLYAVDIASGKIAWEWRAAPDCGGGRDKRNPGCAIRYGISAPPLVIDGAVVAGGLDGRVYVFDAKTGKVLSTHDTATSYASPTKVAGTGGSIDAAGLFAGDGMVFVNSGYGSFGQQNGNVLVAFRPKK